VIEFPDLSFCLCLEIYHQLDMVRHPGIGLGLLLVTVTAIALGLTAFANTTTNQAFACGLDDLTSCFNQVGASSGGYHAGHADARYDHDNGFAYNNVAQCCHSQSWDDEFQNGYSTQWNILQLCY
jgi:hypothetical protein